MVSNAPPSWTPTDMRAALALLSLVTLACGRDRDSSDREAAQPPAARPTAPIPSAAPDTAPAVDSTGAWVVTPERVGPIRLGITLAEALPLLKQPVDTVIGGGCEYARPAGGPGELSLMVEDDRLVRVDVTGGSTATAEGARIGDSERRIQELYPSARRMPHKYTDGAYLVVLQLAPADTIHRYVFETDGSAVTLYRAGVYPQVEYVEGCL